MTREEALRVASICMNADGGCSHCAADLQQQLVRAFPELAWVEILTDVWRKDWGDGAEERAQQIVSDANA